GAASAGLASSFFSAFFAFFAFFAFLAGFASFFASAAGAAASAGAAAGLAASAAKTTAEKETATRAATIVDRTFFICTTSKGNVFDFNYCRRRAKIIKIHNKLFFNDFA